MILGPVAPLSKIMSRWRDMATLCGSDNVISGPPQNANICYRTPKILIVGPCMYCKQRNLYCRYKYMPQRYRLYVSKKNYMFQRYKFYIADTPFICSTYRISMLQIRTLSMSETEISVYNIHKICISVCYIHRICII